MNKLDLLTYRKSTLRLIVVFLSAATTMYFGRFSGYFFLLGILLALSGVFYLLARVFTNVYKSSFFDFFALSLSFGYIIGPSVNILYYLNSYKMSKIFTHAMPFTYSFVGDTSLYGSGISVGILAIVFLIFLGDIFRFPVFDKVGIEKNKTIFPLWIVLLFLAIIIFSFLSGDLGYMGTIREAHSDKVSAIGALAGMILTSMPAILVFYFRGVPDRSLQKIIFFMALIFLFFLIVITGRRFFLISVFEFFLVAVLFHDSIVVKFKNFFAKIRAELISLTILKILILSGVVVFSVMLGMKFFFFIREATYSIPKSNLSLVLSEAYLLYSSSQNNKSYVSSSADRSGTAPGYLGDMLFRSAGGRLKGACFMNGMLDVVPRLFLANKTVLLRSNPCNEYIVNERFNLPPVDSPVTLVTFGYLDFGFFGAIMYPAFMALFFYFIVYLTKISKNKTIYLYAVLTLLFSSLYVEQNMLYYFSTIRNLMLVSVFLFIIQMIVRHLRNRPSGFS